MSGQVLNVWFKWAKQWKHEQSSHLIESIIHHLVMTCLPAWKIFILLLHQHCHHCISSLETFHLFIDQWEAELGQPGDNMAPLRFCARSLSKHKNPIPSQAQKRHLSKGGPPEVTVACLHPEHYWWLLSKRHEREGGRVGCLCSSSRGLYTSLFTLCCIDMFGEMFAKLKG